MNKPKPELQYKKLTKKQITIKYKQNDFKDILCSLEDENLSNNYDEMLLNRPFTEAKQKNEIKSVKIIKEEKNSLENSEEKEEDLREVSQTIISQKKGVLVNKCVNQIESELFVKFLLKEDKLR